MSLKLDFDRIRERLIAAGLSSSVVVASVTGTRLWMHRYSQDVRALRAAYKRERSIRLNCEDALLRIGSLAEMPQDGEHDNRLIRNVISDRVRSTLGIGKGPLVLPPRSKRP